MMASDQLRERAQEFWLSLDDVSITDLSFGTEFTAAIEAKQGILILFSLSLSLSLSAHLCTFGII